MRYRYVPNGTRAVQAAPRLTTGAARYRLTPFGTAPYGLAVAKVLRSRLDTRTDDEYTGTHSKSVVTFALEIADELEMDSVIVPYASGVLSAVGLIVETLAAGQARARVQQRVVREDRRHAGAPLRRRRAGAGRGRCGCSHDSR